MKSLKHFQHVNGKKIVMGAIFTILIIVGINWSWNTVAVELFELPEAQFKHALAFVIGLSCACTILRWGGKGKTH